MENFCGANAFCAQPKHQALVQSFQLTSARVAPTLADFLLCWTVSYPCCSTENSLGIFKLSLQQSPNCRHAKWSTPSKLLSVSCEKFMSPLAWWHELYPPHVLPAASGCSFSSWLACNCPTVLWCPAKPFLGCFISTECFPPIPASVLRSNAMKGRAAVKLPCSEQFTSKFTWNESRFSLLEEAPWGSWRFDNPTSFHFRFKQLGQLWRPSSHYFSPNVLLEQLISPLQEASSDICAGGMNTVLRLGLEMPVCLILTGNLAGISMSSAAVTGCSWGFIGGVIRLIEQQWECSITLASD